MVRNLVGTFILVGERTITRAEFARILLDTQPLGGGRDRPASGLFLESVEY